MIRSVVTTRPLTSSLFATQQRMCVAASSSAAEGAAVNKTKGPIPAFKVKYKHHNPRKRPTWMPNIPDTPLNNTLLAFTSFGVIFGGFVFYDKFLYHIVHEQPSLPSELLKDHTASA